MSSDLQHRIQKVYPEGTTCSLDVDALQNVERDQRIRSALDYVSKARGLLYDVQPFDKPAYNIGLTQADYPSFVTWVWSMDNAAKIRWIKVEGSGINY